MTKFRISSIRFKLTAAFLFLAVLIPVVAVTAVRLQHASMQRATESEAEDLASSIAYIAVDDILGRSDFLQHHIDSLDRLYRRNIVVVDRRKMGIAAANREEVGVLFADDGGNEVGQTIADGKTRYYVEYRHTDEGTLQVVVPLYEDQGNVASPIIGAVILEYTQLYEKASEAAMPSIYFMAGIGALAFLFSLYFGRKVTLDIGYRMRELQTAVSLIADGDYDNRLVAGTGDEVSELGTAVNKMASALDESRAAQLSYSAQLEENVRLRTRELVTTNALLRKEMDEHKISAERNENLANFDVLTSLPNRGQFHRLLEHCLKSAARYEKKLAVFFIDLDRFKFINDTLGHEAGDTLLIEVGKRIKTSLRDSDFVARFGGDEFVILVPEFHEVSNLEAVAEKILHSVSEPLTLKEQQYRISASIGIATFPEDGRDASDLLRSADLAMYEAKKDGKNTYLLFSEQLQSHSFERVAMESSLRQALERNEFEVYYQAKVDGITGVTTGMEALLRWNHPSLGVVAPMRFIPVAEEIGLIVDIGKWVLRTACRQSVAWQRAGLENMTMAVNLSMRQFSDTNLVRDIAAILGETGMPPRLLELEITETMLMQDLPRTMATLKELKAMSIRLAIDDFGTGYSSLATLKQFPVDTIKIDKSFIDEISVGNQNHKLTQAIVAMGKSLSLNVVAEGVETVEQVRVLAGLDCHDLQGFFFSTPEPAEAFYRQLQRTRGEEVSEIH